MGGDGLDWEGWGWSVRGVDADQRLKQASLDLKDLKDLKTSTTPALGLALALPGSLIPAPTTVVVVAAVVVGGVGGAG